ncbi:MAG TPA: hypothetical protein VF690_14520 [Hymenobacter sp.]|jgi:hypothetical protein
MGFEHAADAPAADRVALGLHLGTQPARAVTLAVLRKRFAHRDLPSRLGNGLLAGAPLSVIRGRCHAQHLAELAHGHVGLALGDVLVGAHRVG